MQLKLSRQGSTLEAVLDLTFAERNVIKDLGLANMTVYAGKTIPEFELGVQLPANTDEQALRSACLDLKRRVDRNLSPGSSQVIDLDAPPQRHVCACEEEVIGGARKIDIMWATLIGVTIVVLTLCVIVLRG